MSIKTCATCRFFGSPAGITWLRMVAATRRDCACSRRSGACCMRRNHDLDRPRQRSFWLHRLVRTRAIRFRSIAEATTRGGRPQSTVSKCAIAC